MITSTIQIRFADCDLAGHVHNAAYLHYFESARIHFFTQELGSDWDYKSKGLILKRNEIDYEQPLYFGLNVLVDVSTSHIGNKSFTLRYEVHDGNGTLYASGNSLVVCMDFIEGKTIDIPTEMRLALEKHLKKDSLHNAVIKKY